MHRKVRQYLDYNASTEKLSSLPCDTSIQIHSFNLEDRSIRGIFEYIKSSPHGICTEWLPIGLLMNQEAIMNAIDPMSQAEKSKLAAEEIDKALLHVKASSEVVSASEPILKNLENFQERTMERLDAIDKRIDALETKSCCTIT